MITCYVPSSCREITKENIGSFIPCKEIKDLVIKERNMPLMIGLDAFTGYSIDNLILQGDIGNIDKSAFEGCKILNVVFKGGLIAKVGERSFQGNRLTSKAISRINAHVIADVAKDAFYCQELPLKTIWSSNVSIEDWKGAIEESYMPNYIEDGTIDEDMTVDEFIEEYSDDCYEYAQQCNANYLDDERANLHIQVKGDIIVIATLGLWDGRRSGYHISKSKWISDCLYGGCNEDMEWFVQGDDLIGTGHHHDGTNHYLYREIRPTLSKKRVNEFLELLSNKELTINDDLSEYTRPLGKYIAKVYGW